VTAPDWPSVIRTSSPADLGWSADSPAPEEALRAVREALAVRRRRVLTVGRTRGGGALTGLRARFGDLQEWGRPADDALTGELAAALGEAPGVEAVVRAGRRIQAGQQQGGTS
jgi:hypothetical protein